MMSLIRTDRFIGFDETKSEAHSDWVLWKSLFEKGFVGVYVGKDLFKTMFEYGSYTLPHREEKVDLDVVRENELERLKRIGRFEKKGEEIEWKRKPVQEDFDGRLRKEKKREVKIRKRFNKPSFDDVNRTVI